MKILISADGADLEASVANRFGTSRYLVIVDTETGDFDAVPNPGISGQRGSGMQAVVLAVSKDVKAVLTGYCAPAICNQLEANDIEVLTGLDGRVREIVERYKQGNIGKRTGTGLQTLRREPKIGSAAFIGAIRNSVNQFAGMLPAFVGVVLLIGLFHTFASKDFLAPIFSGNVALDTLRSASFGSILAGNPINSYIIAGELLKYGLSLVAVTALIITWVTVGLIQLPAEIAALGTKFAILRNVVSFVLSIPIAILTVAIFNLVKG